jgi:hypothetical protein
VFGAPRGTENVIVPTSVPLPVTPTLYALSVPIPGVVLIQNGYPAAFTLKVYVNPLTKFKVGSLNPSMT